VNRSTVVALGLGLALAASGCGRYGPPIRRIDAAEATPEPVAESAPTDDSASKNAIETFEDEPIP